MSSFNKSKVYEEVLDEIRRYINEEGLQAGDKLPSERALADKLQAARSSVREALRAMELLGLIETRRGEGTYLRDYRPYQAVELLSSFILQDSNTRKDIRKTKKLIEREALKQVLNSEDDTRIRKLDVFMNENALTGKNLHHQFFYHVVKEAENDLLSKIWQLLEEFTYSEELNNSDHAIYFNLLENLKQGEEARVEELLEELYS